MKLRDRIAKLSTISTTFGIWADAPFTDDSDSRVGQTQFENGGLLDEKEFVGTLENLCPDVCEWTVIWTTVMDTAGYGESSHVISTEPAADADYLLEIIADHIRDEVEPEAELTVTSKELQQWIEGDKVDSIAVAESGSTVNGFLWELEYTDILEIELDNIIADAEEERFDRKRTL